MKFYALDICPNKTSGLCNQLYSIAAGIKFCIKNNINIMFINKFLRSINTDNYSNISEIINLDKFNEYLKQYNIFIVDFNNFNLSIEDAELTDNINVKNIKSMIINSYYKKNSFYIKKNSKFYLINSNEKQIYLKIKYNLNNKLFCEKYLIEHNELVKNIDYDFDSLHFEGNFKYTQDELFFNILRNLTFSDTILHNSSIKNNNLLNNKKTNKINTIHLRIEDDVIKHYSNMLNIDPETLKNIVENKYIDIINTFDKSDLIILLSYSKNNKVIDHLKSNGYNYVIDNDKDKDREISAIYDLLLGENCNNHYVCVWESSYSYTLFSRINKKNNVKNAIQIYYENLARPPDSVRLMF